MFTGIVQGKAQLVRIDEKEAFRTHVIEAPESMLEGLQPGASVAHNGCCLTVTSISGRQVQFDLMRETLAVTNLGALKEGDWVNVERAARFGDEIGGHAMSGHILCMADVTQIERTANNYRIALRLPPIYAKYLFAKGYIGLDGISLTVGAVENCEFDVNLIPETLARTTIGNRKIGDAVNVEIDPQTQVIVDTVERVLASQKFSTKSLP